MPSPASETHSREPDRKPETTFDGGCGPVGAAGRDTDEHPGRGRPPERKGAYTVKAGRPASDNVRD
jgi:hypothetical protein